MKGPLEKGHYPTIPENTEVLNVTIADRSAMWHLTEYFLPMRWMYRRKYRYILW